MPDTKKTINDLTTTSATLADVNIMVQPKTTSNTLEKMDGSLVAAASDVTALQTGITSGTVVAKKAECDASGNTITTTYATKAELTTETNARIAADTELKNAITDTEQRVQNIEVALSGTVVQTNTDSTQANVKSITSADTIPPWAILKRVGARSVKFNQLYVLSALVSQTLNNCTATYSDGVVTVTPVTYGSSSNIVTYGINYGKGSAHKSLVFVSAKLTAGSGTLAINAWTNGGTGYSESISVSDTNYHTFMAIVTGPSNNDLGNLNISCNIASGTMLVNSVMRFDLTDMEMDSLTADQFRAKFPATYYPYNAGTLIDLAPTSFLIRGKNLFDQEWELGSLDLSTGEEVPSSNVIRSSNFIRAEPSQTYFFKFPNQTSLLYFYDASKNFLGYYGGFNGNLSYQIPSNCYYLRFITASTTYNNDIQICLNSYSGKNTFHDYVSTTIDTSFMSGKKYVNPSCYDYAENVYVNGVVMRKEHRIVGSYTFTGNETWTKRRNGSGADNYVCNNIFSAEPAKPNGDSVLLIDNGFEKGNGYSGDVPRMIMLDSISIYVAVPVGETPSSYFTNGTTLYYEMFAESDPTYSDPIPNFPCEDGTTITAITPQTDLVNAIDVPSTIAYMTQI